jgi:hypothetical protein
MNKAFGTLALPFGFIGIVLAHLIVSYVLPPPWGHVNAMFVLLSLMLLVGESGMVVWMAFASHFVLELYATTPFGIILFSGTCTLLAVVWLFRYLFTNRSWYTAFAVSAVGVALYRLLYSASLLIARAFGVPTALPWRHLAVVYGWEILLTSLATGVLYILLARPFRKKRLALPTQWMV